MKRLRLLFCLALLIVAGSAVANPYGYAYYRTVTIDHTKVGTMPYLYYRTVTIDHTKVTATFNGYAYNRAITFDHTKVGTVNNTDQTNFPVLLSGTFDGSANALDVRTAANGGPIQNTTTLNSNTVPADLIFTSDSGCVTRLNWEIVSYSASTGAMEAWVQIPTLSHSSDTTIYACYKNSSQTTYQGNATGTWDSNFVAVYHLNNNAANTTVTESTSHGYTATNTTNTSSDTTAGQITNGLDYKGTEQSRYTSGGGGGLAGVPSAQKVTMSAWVNPASVTQSQRILSEEDASFSAYWSFVIDTNFVGGLEMAEAGGNCTTVSHPLGTGSWQYVTFVFDGSQSFGSRCKMYLNGASVSVAGNDALGATMPGGDYPFAISGWAVNTSNRFQAKYDEVRVSTTNRSADWIVTEYNNQNSPSTFLKSVGAQTLPSLSNFPVLVSGTYDGTTNPFDARTAGNGGKIQNTTTLNGFTVPADLIFTTDAACTAKLNWEVVNYVSTTGVMEAWVQVPSVSSGVDTVFYMCYDNPGVTTYQATATSTWDANYLGVWHTNGNPGGTAPQELDSTTHGKSLSVQCCGTPALVAGQIGNGVDTTFTQGFTGGASSFSTTLTASAWIKTTSGGVPGFMGQFDGNGLGAGFGIGENGTNSGYLRLSVSAGLNGGNSQQTYDASSGSVNDGNWHYAVFTYVSGTGFVMYVDGNSIGTFGAGYTGSLNNGATFYFVNFNAGGYQWNGVSDEARLSNIARDAGWIKTEYTNQKTPSSFTALGSETSTAVDESNFPVLVFCSACTYLKTGANGGQIQKTATLNGQTVPVDLIFTSDAAGQTLLNWEVASYNASTGDTEVWVKIPTLSHTTDTVIYMWYNNANIAATYLGSATSVWDANYKAIYHLPNGTTLSGNDSTSNAFNAGFSTTPPTATTGQIDGGGNFVSGSSEYMSPGNDADMTTNDITLSGWINAPAANQFGAIISKKQVSGAFTGYTLGVGWYASNANMNTARTIFCDFYDGGTFASTAHHQLYHTTNNVVDGNWHYVLCNRASGIVSIYVDGVSQALTADVAGTTNVNVTNGANLISGFFDNNGSGSYYNGKEDELRVSNIARPVDWITTEYYNQKTPSTFETIGSQNIAQHHAKGFME